MKRILFVTRSYPNTRRSATILCTHRIIDCVKQSEKYDVHVLAYKYPGETTYELINGVVVHRVNASLFRRLLLYFSIRRKQIVVKWGIKVLKFFAIPWYPNDNPLSSFLLFRKASVILKQYGFDLVATEYHDEDALLCGCRLKNKNRCIKHISFLWDPVTAQIPTTKLPKLYSENRFRKLENFLINNSSVIVSMEAMKDYYSERVDPAGSRRHYLGIPGILPPDEEINTSYLGLIKRDLINIVYSGQLIMGSRDPMPIIKLLNECDHASMINLIFFSVGAKSEIESVASDFKGTIVYHEYIPLMELHTVYRHADYLLNISHVNAKMVPSKIFEYMSYGKPIISTYTSEGDSAESYLRRYPESLCLDLKHNNGTNIEAINVFFNKEHHIIPFDYVKREYRNNTPDAYLELIDSVLVD